MNTKPTVKQNSFLKRYEWIRRPWNTLRVSGFDGEALDDFIDAEIARELAEEDAKLKEVSARQLAEDEELLRKLAEPIDRDLISNPAVTIQEKGDEGLLGKFVVIDESADIPTEAWAALLVEGPPHGVPTE